MTISKNSCGKCCFDKLTCNGYLLWLVWIKTAPLSWHVALTSASSVAWGVSKWVDIVVGRHGCYQCAYFLWLNSRIFGIFVKIKFALQQPQKVETSFFFSKLQLTPKNNLFMLKNVFSTAFVTVSKITKSFTLVSFADRYIRCCENFYFTIRFAWAIICKQYK